MKNYYEILGVSKEASQDEIKKQYRKLSKQYHPDINPTGADKFKEIAEAYDVLSDENKRQVFDRGGDPNSKNPFGGQGGFGNMDDFLRNMGFNGDPFGSTFNNQRQQSRVPDTIIELLVNPVESFLGSKKNLNFVIQDECNTCSGAGGTRKVCSQCGGQGYITQTVGTGFFRQMVQNPCGGCNTTGYQITNACKTCSGKGTLPKQQNVDFNLPVGCDDGDFFRLGMMGNYYYGAGRGNVVVKVVMTKEGGYEKMGRDLVYNKIMTPLELLLDNTFNIPHPSGDLKVNKPLGLNTEKPLRLKGKGYTIQGVVGDMYVKLHVRNTDEISETTKEKIRQILAEE